jgi:hypothetical protein
MQLAACNIVALQHDGVKRGGSPLPSSTRSEGAEWIRTFRTDNTNAEAAYFCGLFKSRQLHGLVLRLRLLEMRLGIIIRVIPVSGKIMIRVGVDGVSRGDLNAGVMAGANMRRYT